jgi:hypothetical protein
MGIRYETYAKDLPVEGKPYRIIAKHSGKALDIKGESKEDGAELIQYTYHGGNNQLFYFLRLIPGFKPEPYDIHVNSFYIFAGHSNKCLTTVRSGFHSVEDMIGKNLVQHTHQAWNSQLFSLLRFSDSSSPEWAIVPAEYYNPITNEFTIKEVYPFGVKGIGILDVCDASKDDSANVIVYAQNDKDNQRFLIQPV